MPQDAAKPARPSNRLRRFIGCLPLCFLGLAQLYHSAAAWAFLLPAGHPRPSLPPNPRPPMMRTEQARPIRLEDYRPPDWLVETVELDVSLDPTATRVRATLALKPNPQAAAPAPLVLDGDRLSLVSVKLDGNAMAADGYAATPDSLVIAQ